MPTAFSRAWLVGKHPPLATNIAKPTPKRQKLPPLATTRLAPPSQGAARAAPRLSATSRADPSRASGPDIWRGILAGAPLALPDRRPARSFATGAAGPEPI